MGALTQDLSSARALQCIKSCTKFLLFTCRHVGTSTTCNLRPLRSSGRKSPGTCSLTQDNLRPSDTARMSKVTPFQDHSRAYLARCCVSKGFASFANVIEPKSKPLSKSSWLRRACMASEAMLFDAALTLKTLLPANPSRVLICWTRLFDAALTLKTLLQ